MAGYAVIEAPSVLGLNPALDPDGAIARALVARLTAALADRDS